MAHPNPSATRDLSARVYPAANRLIANDGALTVVSTDAMIGIANSTTGTKAATVSNVQDGQSFSVQLLARAGGAYTVACSSLAGVAGAVTLDAAGEGADFFKVGGVIYVFRLIGTATFA